MADPRIADWTDVPCLLPWRYRHQARLTPAFAFRVSGPHDGTRHEAAVCLCLPEGRLKKIWSEKFEIRRGASPWAAKKKALSLFLGAARTDRRLSRRVTIELAMDGARKLLERM